MDSDPLIRKVSKPVTSFDENLWELLDDMKETMEKEQGIGLAAVQGGVLKRVFLIELNHMFFECINPQIIAVEGEQEQEEGCLSIDHCTGLVKRPAKVTVKAFDRYANEFTVTGTDYLAIALNHEYDHLDGVLFTDKATQIFSKGQR